jgi:hypothetical protein
LGIACCLLALAGCGAALPLTGDWVGERDVAIPKGEETPIDYTLKRVELKVEDGGRFTLIDKSIPYQGRLDMTAKTQTLGIESVIGTSVARMAPGATPTYKLTWVDDNAIKVEGPGTDIVLHRNSKPASG